LERLGDAIVDLKTCGVALAALSLAVGPAAAEPATPILSAAPAVAPPSATINVPEGTEFPVRLEDTLSSKTAQEGERFTISLVEDVPLPDGTILRAGYRGVGEVVDARKNGMMGKAGRLSVRLNYIRVGDQRIRLRATKSAQGDHRTGAQVVTVVLVGVFAGFIKGKNTEIPRGAPITAFTDQDTTLQLPVAPPPPEA
jgi:hypothetical protein